jgi:hypothetical protein
LARAHRKHRLRTIEGLNLRLFVNAQTRALVGGLRYSPTMSRTFSMNSGPLESLKVSLRWGASAKARQMRLTLV